MQYAVHWVLLCAWCSLSDALMFRKNAPDDKALNKFIGKKLAKTYVKEMKKKEWQENRCREDSLPEATRAMTDKFCQADVDRGPCVCMIAKAHSCHIACNKKLVEKTVVQEACPESCNFPSCMWGNPSNGGLPLSNRATGTCKNYCSAVIGPVRYCGVGGLYQSGDFVDCSHCNPSVDQEDDMVTVSAGYTTDSEMSWTECMADCYPNPTCTEMCSAGTPECRTSCIERYEKTVVPFKHMFDHSSKQVPDFVPNR